MCNMSTSAPDLKLQLVPQIPVLGLKSLSYLAIDHRRSESNLIFNNGDISLVYILIEYFLLDYTIML